jgi:flagellar protein FliO/FliZ
MHFNSIYLRATSLLCNFLAMVVLVGFCGTAMGQSNAIPVRFGSAGNDPTVVRPQGHSVQSNPNSNHSTEAPSRFPPDNISVQPSGQRVFNQNLQPQGYDANHSTQRTSDTAVQPASWTTETSNLKVNASTAREPIELKPSSKEALNSISKPKSSWATAISMMFSLAIVLSLFLIIAWLFRRTQPNTFAKLPSEVVQVMGRTAMAPRQQVYVVRFGSKMLLVSHQPGQTQTLGEITDVDEVQRLAGMCEASQPNSISHSFRDVLRQVASGRSDSEPRTASRKRTRLNEA